VIERRPVEVSDAQIEHALERFRGSILQVPPAYSALKRGGQPLYRLARQGRAVEVEPREVHVHRLELLARHGPLIELRVACSKGTYVRSLADDIGSELGTGGCLAGLRRTATGGFRLEEATGLEALQEMAPEQRDRVLLPLDRLLAGMQRVELDAGTARKFEMGQTIVWPGLQGGLCAVYRPGAAGFVGVGEADGAGRLRPRRLAAAPDRQDATG